MDFTGTGLSCCSKGSDTLARLTPEDWNTPERLALIEGYARRGYNDEQVADKMGIARSTLFKWRKICPAINDALKSGKEEADVEVENALFRRATGYDATEEHVEYECGIETKRVTNIRHVPPDTGAACFWLKNRRPEEWRDKRELEQSGESTLCITIDPAVAELAE